MSTYQLTIEYDGTDFHGWQVQPEERTVEGELRDAVRRITGEDAVITSAGRTDAGAHAHGQVVGLTLKRRWQPPRLASAINALLPEDVVVTELRPAAAGFHARYDAITRTYKYIVAPRPSRSAVTRRHAWTVRGPLDIAAMQHAASALVGTRDFAAFGRPPRKGASSVRTVHEATVQAVSVGDAQDGSNLEYVVLAVRADAFLRGMMRAFAGAIVAVGQGRLSREELEELLAAGATPSPLTVAPAHGLHQWAVTYGRDPVRSSSAA